MADQAHIRNFSIIAHIDHGKSTLADRILELTHTVDPRAMRAQVLDSMELERERGITIKAQAVRVFYDSPRDGQTYQLHLIDTPGHVDFTYEVSRSLAACEGALLVVDASQGVEAQTVANTYLALGSGLELIPCLNKIDLPGAEPERVAGEVSELIGESPDSILRISGKTGEGVAEVLEELIARVPPPSGDPEGPPRALIFDSEFDQYRGVIAYIRVVDGVFRKRELIRAMATGTEADIDDIGFFSPQMMPTDMPAPATVAEIREPFIRASVIAPKEYVGAVMELCQERRGEHAGMHYLSPERVQMTYDLPLAEIVLDFFDQLKSRTRGYASLDYELSASKPSDLVKLDVLLAGDPVDALSLVVHREKAYEMGRTLTEKLRKRIPRQQYDVPIQAAIGSHVIARETVKAYRKDVIAKCYGGDITRKRKLLEKQKEGKKRMKLLGRVEVPQEAFLAVLELGEE